MARTKKRQKKAGSLTIPEVTEMLLAAIKNHDDFILTWEPRPGEKADQGVKRELHVMTGNLITTCRLNNLKGRVAAYEDEGARIVTRDWE